NVVTSCIAFEGQGVVKQYVGGYQDWLRQRSAIASKEAAAAKSAQRTAAPPQTQQPAGKTRLSYKLQRELDLLPPQIEKLEREIAALEQEVARPEFYTRTQAETERVFQTLGSLQKQLDTHYSRWQELEQQQ